MSVHEREDALITRLTQLAPSLDGEPDPAFRAATRARLVAMAAVRTPGPEPASGLRRLLGVRVPDAPPPRWRTRLTAGLAGAALTVTALATVVAVADGARPGDVLYDLKRGTEQTQLALAGDARGRTLLELAGSRLAELEELAGADVPATDPALVLETLQTMDEQTREGAVLLTARAVETSDERPVELLETWTDGQAGELASLQGLVPDAATAAVGRSLDLLASIGARTEALQTALACPAGPAVDGADDLGPVPADCPAPEPAPPAPGGGSGSGTSTPGGGAPPEATTPTLPTVPPTTGTGPGGSGPGLPNPGAPNPSPGGGLVPPIPSLPTGITGGGTTTGPSSPVVQVPGEAPISVCVPPLLTFGNC